MTHSGLKISVENAASATNDRAAGDSSCGSPGEINSLNIGGVVISLRAFISLNDFSRTSSRIRRGCDDTDVSRYI